MRNTACMCDVFVLCLCMLAHVCDMSCACDVRPGVYLWCAGVAGRAQKQRAERGEGELERLRGQLMEKEGHLNDLNAQLSVARSRLEKDGLQKEQAEVQRSALQK